MILLIDDFICCAKSLGDRLTPIPGCNSAVGGVDTEEADEVIVEDAADDTAASVDPFFIAVTFDLFLSDAG